MGQFTVIIDEGFTGEFDWKGSNNNWNAKTRPIIEAFMHAHFFLCMAVKVGRSLEDEPDPLGDGFLTSELAALLYLFNLR